MNLWNKMMKLTGTPAFFMLYLVFFAIALFLCAGSDFLFPDKITDESVYRGVCRYPWTRGMVRAIGTVHLCGGIVFFIRLCGDKLGIDW